MKLEIPEGRFAGYIFDLDGTLVDSMPLHYRAWDLAMRRAVDALPARPDALIIDGREVVEGGFAQRPVIRGDARCASVAAASIVAKVARDQLMRDLDADFPGYGLAENKGYGTPEHLAALSMRGYSSIHRLSFAAVREAVRR